MPMEDLVAGVTQVLPPPPMEAILPGMLAMPTVTLAIPTMEAGEGVAVPHDYFNDDFIVIEEGKVCGFRQNKVGY